jgi:5-methylcytosine-specific restriction endonuclease McrA
MDKAMRLSLKKSVKLNAAKQKLVTEQRGICVACGQLFELELEALEIDHILPKADGGTDK